MSSGIKNKLYNLELKPPVAVWEKIAAELDESALAQKFPSRLYNAEVIPATSVWQSIAASLDEQIMEKKYAEKLANIHVIPPPAVWNKIRPLLDVDGDKTTSEQRKISPIWKYAAAAIITGVLAWGGVQLFADNSTETNVAKQDTTQPKNSTETAVINSPLDATIADPGVIASLEEARNDAALEASKKTFAKLDVTTNRSKIKNAADFFFISDDPEPTGTRGFRVDPIESPSTDINNRYIILMTPDGNIIRMSKKLKELVCCVSGEDQDKDCIDQLKKWRENISNPSTTHSSSNFFDLLNIVKSMQEN